MNFNKHSNLVDKHAFLGASKYHWINYSTDKIRESYQNFQAVEKGTRLHKLAKDLIDMKVRLPKSKKTLNCYVNDAIGFHMTTEQVLYFSDNCFGTADTIHFADNFLRIHDLKTGVTPASIFQLYIYEALFCLEYGIRPGDIQSELRIYQNDDCYIEQPTVDKIAPIMDKIITFDKIINSMKEG